MDWTMQVSSKQAIDGGWPAEAKRLRGFFDLMTQCLEPEYQEPLLWTDEDFPADQWANVDVIAAELEHLSMDDANGEPSVWGEANGVSFAHRASDPNPSLFNNITTMHWSVGGDNKEWQFSARMEFDPDEEDAKQLQDHSVAWLVHTLSSAAAYVNAVKATIDTRVLSLAMSEEEENRLDEYGRPPVIVTRGINLAPNGIGNAQLPSSITAHPCPVGYPEGVVLVPDMDRLINDPTSLVDDLFTLDTILKANYPS